MRTLIVYESQSGSTKKYAEDIAKAVSADLLPLKKFKAKIIPDYDCIVFGGWVERTCLCFPPVCHPLPKKEGSN